VRSSLSKGGIAGAIGALSSEAIFRKKGDNENEEFFF
jgi:hypothetical protein